MKLSRGAISDSRQKISDRQILKKQTVVHLYLSHLMLLLDAGLDTT